MYNLMNHRLNHDMPIIVFGLLPSQSSSAYRPAFGGTVPHFHQMSREMRQMSRIFRKWYYYYYFHKYSSGITEIAPFAI